MPRIYVTSVSYPELRETESMRERHRVWRRAFVSGLGDHRFWRFFLIQCAGMYGWYRVDQWSLGRVDLPDAWVIAAHLAFVCVAIVVHGYLTVTWGGDIMRPHLRRTCPRARKSCPNCGHLLTSHLLGKSAILSCPECGEHVKRGVFNPPYHIPRKFRALPWLGRA